MSGTEAPAAPAAPQGGQAGDGRARRALGLDQVSIDDEFWSPRVTQTRHETIPFQHEQLERTGRLSALRLDWTPGDPPPHVFWDSDVAKWIEAASYSLATHPDPALDRQVDEAIALLRGAQRDDGYLNTYFSTVEPTARWTDLRDAHELYCAGHLIEAGVAHHRATGKTSLLDVVCRYADYIGTVFGTGPGQLRGYPGHEEIELALVKLYRLTGHERYLALARYFVDERGGQPFYFEAERVRRGTEGHFAAHFPNREREPEYHRQYNQSHLPVREQPAAVGHAVRAMYLYTAMADLALETGDAALDAACLRLWDEMHATKLYVTGGLGAEPRIEGFGPAYHLPNETAYAETCASIGLIFFAHRMSLLHRDGRYLDTMELALFNAVLGGASLDGKRYFYDNPLASDGGAGRSEWFDVACCPPNLARLLTSLGGYVYGQDGDELLVNLYVGSRCATEIGGASVVLHQSGGYPWRDSIALRVQTDRPAQFALTLRIPGWCHGAQVRVNDEPVDLAGALADGYATLRRRWRDGDRVELRLPMPVRRVYAHPAVAAAAGQVALARGPIVYCVEGVDNPGPLHALRLPQQAELTAVDSAELGGVVVLTADAVRESAPDGSAPLYSADPPAREPATLTAVPYFARANRGDTPMRVWLRDA